MAVAAAGRPLLPPEIPQVFLAARGPDEGLHYEPGLLGLATVHYRDDRRGIEHAEELALLMPLSAGAAPGWRRAETLDRERWDPERDLDAEAREGAGFGALPAAAAQVRSYRAWEQDLADLLYRERRLELPSCRLLGESARPGESERDFRIRLAERARERRDAEKERLRQLYAARLAGLAHRVQRGEERVEREREQAREQKTHTLVSFGETALSALFGRRAFSRTTVSRASTAFKGVSRSAKEGRDVERAEGSLGELRASLAGLEAELERELQALAERFAPEALALETAVVRPRRTDVEVRKVALAWMPQRETAAGREPAWR